MPEPQLKTGRPPADARLVVCDLAVGMSSIGQAIVAVSATPDPSRAYVNRVWVGTPLFLGELGPKGLTGDLLKGTSPQVLQMFERIARELAKPPASVIIPPW